MGVPEHERVNVRIPAKINFFMKEEYITMLYYGLLPEINYVSDRNNPFRAFVRFCEIANLGNRKYWVFIAIDENTP
jgi:hypothetical protein